MKKNIDCYRLLTCMFLHSGMDHIVNNMLILWFLGGYLERQAGHIKFLILYFATGILAGIASMSYNIYIGRHASSSGFFNPQKSPCFSYNIKRLRRVSRIHSKNVLEENQKSNNTEGFNIHPILGNTAIIIINIAVFLAFELFGRSVKGQLLYSRGALDAERVIKNQEYYRLRQFFRFFPMKKNIDCYCTYYSEDSSRRSDADDMPPNINIITHWCNTCKNSCSKRT